MVQYFWVKTHTDVCAPVQMIAPGAEEAKPEEKKVLENVIALLKSMARRGLVFVKINMYTSKLIFFTDASFTNARDLKGQLGFNVVLDDHVGTGNILHYASNRCRRLTRSRMGSERHALVP